MVRTTTESYRTSATAVTAKLDHHRLQRLKCGRTDVLTPLRASLALLVLSFMFGSGSLSAAKVTSLTEGVVSGDVLGVDDRQRLMVKRSSDGVSVGVPLDSIEEIDFERACEVPDVTAVAFRVVLLDGTIVYGNVEAGSDTDLFVISGSAVGTLKDVELLDCERIERRAVTQADELPPPTPIEIGTRREEWKVYQVGSKLGGDSICDLTGLNDKQARFILAGIDAAAEGGAWRDWDKIRAFVRQPPKVEAPTTLFGIFQTNGGDTIKGEVMSWKDGVVSVKTMMAGTISLPQNLVSSVVFKNGRFVFLSDLVPSKVDEYPFFRATDFDAENYLFKYRKDRAQGGGELKIGGKHFAKGLGVHAISNLTYDANKRFSRFVATVGIDDSAGKRASVEFSVLVDGKEVEFSVIEEKNGEKTTKKAKSTGVLRRDSGAIRIEVDVANARKITLAVSAADNADIDDRANWANAMFVR